LKNPANAPADVGRLLEGRLPRGLRWPRGTLERALGVGALRPALEGAAHLGTRDFVDAAVSVLGVEAICRPFTWRELVPPDGPLLVVANHHFGLLDPLLALSLLLPIRPDLKAVANRSLRGVLPQIDALTVPVAPPSERRRRIDGARDALRHLGAGGALLMFPAGRVAGRRPGGAVEDGPWSPGVGKIVRRCRPAVLPMTFEGRNSPLFYLARSVHFRLGTLLLLRELANKTGSRVPVHLGAPLPYEAVAGISDPRDLAEHLRELTYEPLIAGDPGAGHTQDRKRPRSTGAR
jgi:1-acyl-sn-glycerol-3-phosphate acyltransferase